MIYLKADLKRNLMKTSTIVSLLIVIVLIFLGNWLVYISLTNNLNTSAEIGFPFPLRVGFNIVLNSSIIVSFIIGSLVITDEHKERGYLRILESGYSRSSIVIVKFLEMILLCSIFLIAGLGFHCFLNYLFYGWDYNSTVILINFAKTFTLALIPIFFVLILTILMYLVFKIESIAVGATIFIFYYLGNALNMINMFLKLNIISDIANLLPNRTLSMITSIFMDNSLENINSISFGNSFYELRFNILFCIFLITVTFIISLIIVKRKNFD
ncbi:ABC transporter permease [Anaerosphaera multitolerans]|uniref:ABC transporter permease n=1 Tax=Anaerosphaera multitolerans TaxID=2487351 RepID=A0A437S8M8_9FIRM|nr:ABC transporter permease [Anaerosphaera multitolerans]RVU55198.1 ABC transporter permease [Anaerosphaera multitolerans]